MNKKPFILILILLVAVFLRFYNLMFDSPYFFNPDERNMANAITQFRLPDKLKDIALCLNPSSTCHHPPAIIYNLNPHFFAYGQFPLYLTFFSYQTLSLLISVIPLPISFFPLQSIAFSDAIFWLRFWSATASTLTVLLVFLITRRLFENCKLKIENLAALLAAFTPGLIQSAHFGTTESFLTFFFLCLIYLSILYSSKKILTTYYLLLTTLILGLALSTKISALIFLPIPLLAIFLRFKKNILKILFFSFLILTSSFLILVIASPFNLLDYQGFRASLNYESAVAIGLTKVFYTRQFENTTPILFQAQKIFPYALGLPIFIFGILGIGICLGQLVRRSFSEGGLVIRLIRNLHQEQTRILALLLFSFFIYFLPNAFLYAKWTRFMTPVFPLFSIFATYFLYHAFSFSKRFFLNFQLPLFIIHYSLFILLALPGLAFFTIYTRPDTRIQASQWIYQNIPANSYVLSETANVVDIPVSLNLGSAKSLLTPSSNSKLSFEINNNGTTRLQTPEQSSGGQVKQWNNPVISFNFYDLDENPNRFEELLTHLEKADYIFVPSRRIFANHLRLPDKYPLLSKYYELLFSGKLGFTKVSEINSPGRWPNGLLPGGLWEYSDEQAEETFTVFDHPVIKIYKKMTEYKEDYYRSLFE